MNISWSKPSLSRDFAFFTIVVVIVLSLAAIWVVYETYQEHSRKIVSDMETEATRIDRAMILEIEHSSYLLQALGQQISTMDTTDLRSIAVLLRSFDREATMNHVLSWIDVNNKNVVSSNKGVHTPVDVSDRDFIPLCIEEPWKRHLGTPIQGKVSGKWVLPIAMGLTDSTGKYIGTILISMDISFINKELEKAVKDAGITFSIYSTKLLPLTQRNEDEKHLLLNEYGEQLKKVDFSVNKAGLLAKASLWQSRSMYVYYELSANYNYIILLGVDYASGTIPLRAIIFLRLIQVALVGTFILTLLWLVRSRIITPIAELADITADIARGDKYRTPVSIGGISELYVLSQNIRRLYEYIRETNVIEEENRNKNTILKHQMEAAYFSNKIKSEFLTSMNHDLRTSINTITGLTEIMKNETYGPIENARYLQYCRDIHESSRQLQHLAEDVLQLANAEAGMVHLHEKHIDIRLIINKSIRLVMEKFVDYKINIDVKLPELMPRIFMDEQRLKQIMINIILNIIYNRKQDTDIIISAYTEQDRKGVENFCINVAETRALNRKITKEENPSKVLQQKVFSQLNMPLTKALVAMQKASLEINRTAGKPSEIILRLPRERLVY